MAELSESSELPYPPFELANRVLALSANDLDGYISYEMAGAETRAELLRLVPEGTSLEGKRLLDFGCGAGRTMRHFMAEARDGEVWGADIDQRSVEWLRANLCPPLNAIRCEVDPPLPFDAGGFDFAWAISVFTHLSGNSAEWLLELHRVLKPRGLLMASYMGEWNSETIAGEPWEEDLIGMNVLNHNRGWELGGPMVFMSDWWVREHWGRAFDVVGSSPRFHNQTWVMLRKRDVAISAEELLEPGDDPREWRAVRHNLAQVQRELEAAAEGNWVDRGVRRLQGSPLIERPLRAVRSRVRR